MKIFKNNITVLLFLFVGIVVTNAQEQIKQNKTLNWLELIGKPLDSGQMKLLTDKLGEPNKHNDDDEFLAAYSKVIVKPWRNEGLKLCFNKDPKTTLKWVYFFPEDETNKECKTFLPFGFEFTDTPADLKIKYKNITQVDDDYWIIVDPIKYPDIIFKVNYYRNEITSVTLSEKVKE